MPFAVLFPRYDHPAIEERYASWQSETLLRRDAVQVGHYDEDESAAGAVRGLTAPHVLVVTDPREQEQLATLLAELRIKRAPAAAGPPIKAKGGGAQP